MNVSERILVVDDEPVQRETLAAWLAEDGHAVAVAGSGEEAVALLAEEDAAICFVDLKMPGMDGLETLRRVRAVRPTAAVVIVTAYASVGTAVAAMKEGAQDYLVKPCDPEEISLLVRRLLRVRALERENVLLRQQLERRYRFEDILAKSPVMQEVFALIRQVASLPTTVLIEGESGTGKELVARAIHNSGSRSGGPFVGVSCGAVVETLYESELFGHEKGAFTGAVARHLGVFERAAGGTLFLDEVADIPLRPQADLLRVLQERRFRRVGGGDVLDAEVRVIAASNVPLEHEVAAGRFRSDLYYRLDVIRIELPPLRRRREDIPLLVEHFVERAAAELGREPLPVERSAMRRLVDEPWPGNVRQLENAVERAVVTARGDRLTAEDFAFLAAAPPPAWAPPPGLTLREVEQRVVEAALEHHDGNVSAAAAALGIDRSTLYDKIKRYGLRR